LVFHALDLLLLCGRGRGRADAVGLSVLLLLLLLPHRERLVAHLGRLMVLLATVNHLLRLLRLDRLLGGMLWVPVNIRVRRASTVLMMISVS
jgi:hypothetical protein